MAFDSLTGKLQNIFKSLKGKGRLSAGDVKLALREVKLAMLEADVNFKVVKQFIKAVEEKTVGEDVLEGLNPAQTVIKIVNDELINLMGEEVSLSLKPTNEITVIMLVGLQGAGKTTSAAKMAAKIKSSGRRVLLVGLDIYRPAAIEQLRVNAERVEVPFFEKGTSLKPCEIARLAIDEAKQNNYNTVILDTAGRLHIDDEMMDELISIKNNVDVYRTILVADSMTGQDAVNAAKSFDDKIGLDYVILTKLDGDTRGGAALSIRSVTGKPILYVGVGEKLDELEDFHPDRMVSRILGMGDVLTLIEKARKEVDEDKARKLQEKLKKANFDFNDYLESMNQMSKLGGLKSIIGMLPGMNSQISKQLDSFDESSLDRVKAIILSMTEKEREDPSLLNVSRKNRIARGAGVDISEVNKLVKGFEQSKKMMKRMPKISGNKLKGGFPFFG